MIQKIIKGDLEGKSILEYLRKTGEPVIGACGGRGTCGKCQFRAVSGNLPISSQDRFFFTKEQLEKGFRLACTAYKKGEEDLLIEWEEETGIDSVAEINIPAAKKQNISSNVKEEALLYGIAADIGTTTLAMQLICWEKGTLCREERYKGLAVYTKANSQRRFGADVVSRIEASSKGNGEEMKQLIREDIEEGIQELFKKVPKAAVFLKKHGAIPAYLAANTVMTHLLMGFSCEGLGSYPFSPIKLTGIRTEFAEGSVKARLLPGISAYVGGDITAGLLACGFDQREKPSVFLDLGTNGEMAVGNREKILTASAAAGPAFEGGNIRYGMPGMEGAISQAKWKEGKLFCKTIGDRPPVGICGSGLIEVTAALLEAGILDETGLLLEKYRESGVTAAFREDGEPIVVSQADIRELQLAKAAVRAGLDTLLFHYGVTWKEIETVYIAGGFGYHLSFGKAVQIGLFPKTVKGEAVGNTALYGAVKCLLSRENERRADKLAGKVEEISLAQDSAFSGNYMQAMFF